MKNKKLDIFQNSKFLIKKQDSQIKKYLKKNDTSLTKRITTKINKLKFDKLILNNYIYLFFYKKNNSKINNKTMIKKIIKQLVIIKLLILYFYELGTKKNNDSLIKLLQQSIFNISNIKLDFTKLSNDCSLEIANKIGSIFSYISKENKTYYDYGFYLFLYMTSNYNLYLTKKINLSLNIDNFILKLQIQKEVNNTLIQIYPQYFNYFIIKNNELIQ